jgi:hypothetical protein
VDRVRIAELVWLDERSPSRGLHDATVGGFLDLAFTALRAQAVRSPLGAADGLGRDLSGRAGTSTRPIHGRTWAHLPRRNHTTASTPTSRSPDVSADEARLLGAFGAGGWPGHAPISGRLSGADVEVRNPGVAHRHMLQSGTLSRGLFFPQQAAPEEVDVVIAGAGLAGLATAYALRPRHTLVLEAGDRIAGTAAAGDSERGPFPLAAHYEHELATDSDADIIRLHQELGITHSEPVAGLYPFVDDQWLVEQDRHEQYLDFHGRLWGDVWNLMDTPENRAIAERIAAFVGPMRLPTRTVAPELRALERMTFADWARGQKLAVGPLLNAALDTGFRSDYGGNAEQISAFAGIHYLTCRPYLTGEPRTLSPPNGLAYFAHKLLDHSPEAEVRLHHLVRSIRDHGDHVEVFVLDLEERVTRRFRAQHVVFAAPKKTVKWVFPADRGLFANNVYAAWIVVTMEMKRLPEKEMLFWSNGIYDPRQLYVGVTWANHFQRDDPPVLGHYIVFPPGGWHHLPALLERPHRIVRFCLERLRCLVGRDVSAEVERVVVQKLGHAMPAPVPGTLFTDPNERRASPRVLYAGVDCGRLPLLIEAFDSGLEAAGRIEEGR